MKNMEEGPRPEEEALGTLAKIGAPREMTPLEEARNEVEHHRHEAAGLKEQLRISEERKESFRKSVTDANDQIDSIRKGNRDLIDEVEFYKDIIKKLVGSE